MHRVAVIGQGDADVHRADDGERAVVGEVVAQRDRPRRIIDVELPVVDEVAGRRIG